MTKRVRSRKSRKIRGGLNTPEITREAIPFRVPNMGVAPRQFRADYIYNNGTIRGVALKNEFIHAVNDYNKDEEDDNAYNLLPEAIRIIRIRGEAQTDIFEGQIKKWNNNQIRAFLVGLQAGDSVRIEFV
jgi:hypothetical protein